MRLLRLVAGWICYISLGFGQSPVGFFYFQNYPDLNSQYVSGNYVRTSIEWGEFEPVSGKFDWNNLQAQKHEALFSDNLQVIPSIRTKSSWAVESPGTSKCSSAPNDLDTVGPLKVGRSYSKTYYAFVKQIAERYRGRFDIVVIENEMNDAADFWCSSVDAYLRVFLTAKKAFADVDPSVRLADGGIQGALLNWMTVNHYLRNWNFRAALSFYKKFTGETISLLELLLSARHWAEKDIYARSMKLYTSGLFDWADLVNFHHYQINESLPEVVAFLRNRVGSKKSIMTNEIGIKTQFSKTYDAAAQELVKKFVRLIALNVSPIIWFTSDGKDGLNAGAFTYKGTLIPETTNAYEAVARFLGQPARIVTDLSEGKMSKFKFVFSNRIVFVLWSSDVGQSIKQRDGCNIYNYLHEQVLLDVVPISTAPIFQVCR